LPKKKIENFDKVFREEEYLKAEGRIKMLSADSGLKKINAIGFAA